MPPRQKSVPRRRLWMGAGVTFADWTRRVTHEASRDSLTGTPTVLLDGKPLADRTAQGLRAAVSAAVSTP